jgi:hypothetical protein
MPSTSDPLSVVEGLPPEHLALLRGLLCGFDSTRLATLAGVPPEAVVSLVQVAVAKLATALRPETDAGRRPDAAIEGDVGER